MNSITHTTSPSDPHAPTNPLETLSTSLIIAGLPSDTFEVELFSQHDSSYVFIHSTFDKTAQPFVLTRWVWLVSYDNRFLSTIHNGTPGYAVSVDDIPALTDRFQSISCEVSAAVQTYFADHNMDPRDIHVKMSGDYITTPEHENTITVTLETQSSYPDEVQRLSQNGWETAIQPDVFTQTSEHQIELSVFDLRIHLQSYFTEIYHSCWENQQQNDNWSLN